MTVSTETNRLAFVGDGTDNSPYAISFPLRNIGSVEVLYVTVATGAEVVKVITTDYTIALASDFATATLTLVTTAPATGVNMVIRRNDPATRLSDYANFDGQPSGTIDSDYDLGALVDQTLQEQLDRTIQVSKGHPNADLPLTPLILKGAAGKTVVVKSDESDFELLTDSIADGTITPAKLLDGTVDNQLIQYDSGAAEWKYEINITIPGTLAVTGAVTLSSTLTVSGSGIVTAASDTDTTHIFGRTKIGGTTADTAFFCHFDRDSADNRAILQTTLGETQIHSSSGQVTGFFIGGTEHVALSATIFALQNGTDFKTPGGTQAFINNASSSVASALVVAGSMSLLEQAAADAQTAAYGQFWVKTAAPNEPWFDGDTGVERQLMQGDGTTVVDESVFVADGTTGGILKETAMIVTVAGAVSGVTTLTATGIVTAATGSLFGNLTLADGSITDSGGAISFGDENLSTTGTLTVTGDVIVSSGDLKVTAGDLGIGVTPITNLHIQAALAIARLDNTSAGNSTLGKGMSGIELMAKIMNTTSKFTGAVKFMSTDAEFTTENPKLLAAIVGVATEAYAADTDGGMAIEFFTTPDNPGATSLPVLALVLDQDQTVKMSSLAGTGSRTVVADANGVLSAP